MCRFGADGWQLRLYYRQSKKPCPIGTKKRSDSPSDDEVESRLIRRPSTAWSAYSKSSSARFGITVDKDDEPSVSMRSSVAS